MLGAMKKVLQSRFDLTFVPKKLNELVINLCCVAIDLYLALLPTVKEHPHLFTNKSVALSTINREIADAYNCINRCVNIGFVLFEEPRKFTVGNGAQK